MKPACGARLRREEQWRQAAGLRLQGLAPAVIDDIIEWALAYMHQTLCHMPIAMLIERRLRGELPSLAPAQFVSIHRSMAGPGIEVMAHLR